MIGIVGRADQGGLAAQTWEMARHTQASRALVIDLGVRGRGQTQPERYEQIGVDVLVTLGMPKAKHWDWLLDGADGVYTAEGTYGPLLPQMAAERGVRLVVHANPELWVEHEFRGPSTRVLLPTAWCADRIGNASVMPMPVNRDVLPFRLRSQAETFWHPAAPAMLDRNGTRLVRWALDWVQHPIRLIVTGDGDGLFTNVTQVGNVTIERRDGDRANYWDGYDEADVMLIPRRYGGLSLPVQEALSSGMPVVMLETGPYLGLGGITAFPARSSDWHWMKGGNFEVHDGDPKSLALAIDALVEDPARVEELSWEAHGAAALLSWSEWARAWRQAIAG